MIQIARYADDHRHGVLDVILPIQQSEFGIPITLRDQPDLLDVPAFYRRGMGNFWVALAAGQVIGTIALLDIGNGDGALRKMFVKSRFRGPELGVARRLLDTLLAWATVQQLKRVYLGTTDKLHAAHRFYEKNGFRPVERNALPASFPLMAVDSLFYRLELNT
jgi:GNAT superfamily N-acetyltransferase